MQILQTVSGFRILFISELAYEELKIRAINLIYGNAEFEIKELTLNNGIHKRISKIG